VQNIQWARVSVWAENWKELALNLRINGKQHYVQNIQWARVSVWAENCKELALNLRKNGK